MRLRSRSPSLFAIAGLAGATCTSSGASAPQAPTILATVATASTSTASASTAPTACATTSAVVTVTAPAPSVAPEASKPPSSPELVRLARARIAAAEHRRQLAIQAYETGTATIRDALDAARAWFVAWRKSGIGGSDLLLAAQSHQAVMVHLLDLAKKQSASGLAGPRDVAACQYGVAEADFWLQQAKENQ